MKREPTCYVFGMNCARAGEVSAKDTYARREGERRSGDTFGLSIRTARLWAKSCGDYPSARFQRIAARNVLRWHGLLKGE